MRKLVLVLIGGLTLSGCASLTGDDGLFRNRAKDYHGATLISSLEVPAGLESPYHSDLYPIPEEISYQQSISLEPPDFGLGDES